MADQALTVIGLLKEVINDTIQLIDNYNSAFSNANDLKLKCKSIFKLLQHYEVASSLPVDEHIKNIAQKMDEANQEIKHYLKIRDKYKTKENSFKRPFYLLKLTYHSWDSNQQFNTLTHQLDNLLRDTETTMHVTNIILEPTTLHFKDEMVNEESIKFWKEICGNEIHKNRTSWPLFASRYQQKYNTDWDYKLKIRIKSVALVEGDVLTIFGFIKLTTKVGFPLQYDYLPDLLKCNVPFSTKERLEIANLLSVHINQYHSTDMLTNVYNVKIWFENKKSHQSIQERAEECYAIYKNIPQDSELVKEETNKIHHKYGHHLKIDETNLTDKEKEILKQKEVLKVNRSKISVVAFYETFKSCFQSGHLSIEILEDIGFPTKKRMESFLYYFEPLDRAYHRLVVKNDEALTDDEWNQVKPSLFSNNNSDDNNSGLEFRLSTPQQR
ncbi:unnamed protein product [Cunninghamella blakesleeana]